jgi:parallel beta-helix repeat protein
VSKGRAVMVLAGALTAAAAAPGATFTVTNTSDSGAGSLRQAITDANAAAGADTIAFAIPGSGVHTIVPTSGLPTVTGPTTIDGTTQPGYAGTPLIEVDFSSASGTFYGILLSGGDSVVRGLCLNRAAGGPALYLANADNNTVVACFLGTDPTGTIARANGSGVTVQNSSGNVIGGTTPADRNLISGNGAGLLLYKGPNTVTGNYIGTDVTGTLALPNSDGMNLSSSDGNVIGGAAGTTPGGPCTGACNVISGNAGVGVSISQATNAVVKGNYIGVDASGAALLGNSNAGVALFAGGGSHVGGSAPGEGNVVSGNYIGIAFNASDGNTIQGNFVGTNAAGTAAIPNKYGGIVLSNFPTNNTIGGAAGVTAGGPCTGACNLVSGNGTLGLPGIGIGVGYGGSANGGSGNLVQGNRVGVQADGVSPLPNSSDGILIGQGEDQNTIGGTDPNAGNVVAYNGGIGIHVMSTDRNAIRSNLVWSNAGLGIDLDPEGVTPNDVGDGDSGSNQLQNFPILTSVTILAPSGAGTRVQGILHSAPSTTYDLDVFSNDVCVPFPHEFLEARRFLGAGQVTTDASGTGAIDVTVAGTIQPGEHVTATATDPDGNTSELSQRIVFSVNPISGDPAGGALLAVSGTDFAAGATVTIGAAPATGVVVNNSTTIHANAPALAAGSLSDVTVTNTDGSAGTLVKGYVADFLDVPPQQQFHSYVTTLVSNSITVGIGSGLYGVGDPTLRQQMAVFILKAEHGLCYTPPACVGTFPDVPCSSNFAPWIEAMAAEGITGGCGNGNFCPQNPVRRDQMAVFLLKAEHGSAYTPPQCQGTFPDVTCPSQFADWIEQLAAEQITGGCGGGNYCPLANNTRGQMAVFITKTFGLQ